MHSKTLIVAGMHRSGTSLITNWLYHCGLQVGENLVGANASNMEGHYEDVEFLKIHEEILADNGLLVTGLIHDKKINISDYELEKIKAIINIKDKRFAQWGWKEPRTCLFLDIYKKLLPQAKYLIIIRDYKAVVSSLLKRDFAETENKYLFRSSFTRFKWKYLKRNRKKRQLYQANAENYLKVWIDYNEHILSILPELSPEDYIAINYSLLEKADEKVFSLLTNKWGFDLKYFPFKKIYKQNLISNVADLAEFIKDKKLVSKAHKIEGAFDQYLLKS
ncbi:MAG: sulfotransferase [Mucilaginibacter sp.]